MRALHVAMGPADMAVFPSVVGSWFSEVFWRDGPLTCLVQGKIVCKVISVCVFARRFSHVFFQSGSPNGFAILFSDVFLQGGCLSSCL